MTIKDFLMLQRTSAYKLNKNNIIKLLEKNSNAKFLDLGCDDGAWTMKLAKIIDTKNVFGYEIVKKAAEKAKSMGVKVKIGDLNSKLLYGDNTFDIIHANQVIEHLNNTDLFLDEIYRILKPNGYAIISTENLSSWHNIFALVLGYMPFSLTNISSKTGAIGNPLAPHYGKKVWNVDSWQHQRIFTIRGLKDLSKISGFNVKKILTSGYYPFGNIFSKIDPSHSAFIAIKISK